MVRHDGSIARARGRTTQPRARAALALLIALAASACATPPAGRGCAAGDPPPRPALTTPRPPTAGDECFPPLLVGLLEPTAPILERGIAAVRLRAGRLADDPRLTDAVARRVRPLDVIVVSNKGRLSGVLIPGVYSHAGIVLGDRRALRALGLWDHPALAVWRADVAAGRIVMETDERGVHLTSIADMLDTDRVAVLRPRDETRRPADRRAGILRLLAHGGYPFDFHFDLTDSRSLFCVELISHALPDLAIAATTVYGRPTLRPDELVRLADTNPARLTPLLRAGAEDDGRRNPPPGLRP